MTAEVVERVRRSARYRDLDPTLLARLAAEELPRSRNADEAVKRVKRRLHQAVGAFRGASDSERAIASLRATWSGDLRAAGLRAACAAALRAHASTRERIDDLEQLFAGIWQRTGGPPATLLDLGCGLAPLQLPWMGLGPGASYIAVDVDRRPLAVVGAFLAMVGQPYRVEVRDLVAGPTDEAADVALLLKLVTTLDRQDPTAAARLLRGLRCRHAVVSFPARSLGGRDRGMVASYRRRLERLVSDAGRISVAAEASVPSELVYVLTLDG